MKGKVEEETVGRIPRDVDNEIKVKTGTYWNTEFIDIRWFYKKGTEMLPSKKGLRINFDELPHLVNLLEKVVEKYGHTSESDIPSDE